MKNYLNAFLTVSDSMKFINCISTRPRANWKKLLQKDSLTSGTHVMSSCIWSIHLSCDVIFHMIHSSFMWCHVLGMRLNCIHIIIVTGSCLYWCVMRPTSKRFLIHSCIYLRILIISYLATFLVTNILAVLMCRKAANQSTFIWCHLAYDTFISNVMSILHMIHSSLIVMSSCMWYIHLWCDVILHVIHSSLMWCHLVYDTFFSHVMSAYIWYIYLSCDVILHVIHSSLMRCHFACDTFFSHVMFIIRSVEAFYIAFGHSNRIGNHKLYYSSLMCLYFMWYICL